MHKNWAWNRKWKYPGSESSRNEAKIRMDSALGFFKNPRIESHRIGGHNSENSSRNRRRFNSKVSEFADDSGHRNKLKTLRMCRLGCYKLGPRKRSLSLRSRRLASDRMLIHVWLILTTTVELRLILNPLKQSRVQGGCCSIAVPHRQALWSTELDSRRVELYKILFVE